MASVGAPSPIRMAPAVISMPACGTVTPKELLMSLSVPGTTITPVPMIRLPSISAHSACGSPAGELARRERSMKESRFMVQILPETPTASPLSW